jgi:hypothetical protein
MVRQTSDYVLFRRSYLSAHGRGGFPPCSSLAVERRDLGRFEALGRSYKAVPTVSHERVVQSWELIGSEKRSACIYTGCEEGTCTAYRIR